MIWVPLRQAPQAITSILVRAEPGYETRSHGSWARVRLG